MQTRAMHGNTHRDALISRRAPSRQATHIGTDVAALPNLLGVQRPDAAHDGNLPGHLLIALWVSTPRPQSQRAGFGSEIGCSRALAARAHAHGSRTGFSIKRVARRGPAPAGREARTSMLRRDDVGVDCSRTAGHVSKGERGARGDTTTGRGRGSLTGTGLSAAPAISEVACDGASRGELTWKQPARWQRDDGGQDRATEQGGGGGNSMKWRA